LNKHKGHKNHKGDKKMSVVTFTLVDGKVMRKVLKNSDTDLGSQREAVAYYEKLIAEDEANIAKCEAIKATYEDTKNVHEFQKAEIKAL